MVLEIYQEEVILERYPKTNDASLRAWSNAELMLLEYIKDYPSQKVYTFNDRFGVWNCVLKQRDIKTVVTYASQQKAILKNMDLNSLNFDPNFVNPLDKYIDIDLALIKIPKSLELFELFLHNICKDANENTEVICCFMTKYFTKKMVTIASLYFNIVEQTKAWKKARLMILKSPKKEILSKKMMNSILFKEKQFFQYYGVFSSGGIDLGTQFLLKHLSLRKNEINVLDLACGNGVIGCVIADQNPDTIITFVDDFSLAIASSKINAVNIKSNFIYADTIESLKGSNFDIIISNPPFHFEHENNIEVSLSLFKMVFSCLKNGGRFVVVANKHLNYKTHLIKIFSKVQILNQNEKFAVYECLK